MGFLRSHGFRPRGTQTSKDLKQQPGGQHRSSPRLRGVGPTLRPSAPNPSTPSQEPSRPRLKPLGSNERRNGLLGGQPRQTREPGQPDKLKDFGESKRLVCLFGGFLGRSFEVWFSKWYVLYSSRVFLRFANF